MSENKTKDQKGSKSKQLEKAREKAIKERVEIPEEVNGDGFIPPEMLEQMPPAVRERVLNHISMQSIGPMPNPLDKKMTSEHITQALSLNAKRDERLFENAGFTRRYSLAYTAIFVLLFVFVTIFLVQYDIELYKEVLKLLIVFGGGFGAGVGLKDKFVKKR